MYVFLCVDMCGQMCVYRAAYVHGAHVCGSQRLMLSVFIDHSPPYFLRQNLLPNLELTDGAGQSESPKILPASLPQWQDHRHAPHPWL